MRRVLNVLAFALGLCMFGSAALSLISNVVLLLAGLDGALASRVIGMIGAVFWMAVGWVLIKSTRRFIGQDAAKVDASALARVHAFYVSRQLAQRPASSLEGNIYVGLSDADLDGVVESINPSAPPARITALLDAVKFRIEENYLPDGRRAPAVLTRTAVHPAAPGSSCAHHPAHPATVTCVRCETSVCHDCSPRWGHCPSCLQKVLDAA